MHGALWTDSAIVLFVRADSAWWARSAVVSAAVDAAIDYDPLDGNLAERANMVIWRQVIVLRIPVRSDQIRLES